MGGEKRAQQNNFFMTCAFEILYNCISVIGLYSTQLHCLAISFSVPLKYTEGLWAHRGNYHGLRARK